ncbi:hypothetical protein GF327_01025 [Candidatus Woesearchaeota archaeon]|nr:hypothetical protein [Candidatus Woesearchaeota archaeon]
MKKIKNIFSKYIFKKDRINFFLLINITLVLLLTLFVFFKFRKIWLIIIFSAIIFLIRLRRKMFGIHLTLEPVILFSVLILKTYGLRYAVIVAVFPLFLSDIASGRFAMDSIISLLTKIIVLYAIMFFPSYNLVIVTMISYILFNEGIGTLLALYSSVPMDQVLTQVMTSTVIRLVYLNIFLYPLCGLLGSIC